MAATEPIRDKKAAQRARKLLLKARLAAELCDDRGRCLHGAAHQRPVTSALAGRIRRGAPGLSNARYID